MAISNGWAGKILRVDLTTRKIETQSFSKEFAIKYLGGKIFAARILYDEVGPEVEPFSPENLAIIGAGTLSGTLAPSSGRYVVAAKSPLTGILGRSNGGGSFGPELKWAGYDLVVIRGKSESPVYLWIEDDHVELRDARHIWGKSTSAARHQIHTELGDPDIGTLLIGPAGENRCLSSAVIGDRSNAAARTSIAAIWGSKNLKGLAARGSKGVNIARPDEYLQICKNMWQKLRQGPYAAATRKYGTVGHVGCAYSRFAGMTKFHGMGRIQRTESLEEAAWDKLFTKNLACTGCPLHCTHYFNVKEGKYKGTKGQGVEGNQVLFAMGMRTPSAEFLCNYNNLCNELGINTDAPGAAINWAMHLWEAGIITKADTDGIELTWGNEEAILTLVRKMAYKEGFGEILDGHPLRGAAKLGKGSDMYASHGKGAYTFSFGPGTMSSLSYSLAVNVATRGFDHLSGGTSGLTPGIREKYGVTKEYLTRVGLERYGDPKLFTEHWAYHPKTAQTVYDSESSGAICDAVGMCTQQRRLGTTMDDFARLLTAATGENFTVADLEMASHRGFTLERAYNTREGMRRIDDYPFFLRWQLEHGKPNPVFQPDEIPTNMEDYDKVLDDYYSVSGYDVKTGIPLRPRLEELGLKDVADDFERRKIFPAAKR